MNLPNKLSVARLALTVPFVALCYAGVPNGQSWALIVFMVASFTDYLDGEIARKRGLITNFGKLFDPLADKILMAAALTMLAIERAIPAWRAPTHPPHSERPRHRGDLAGEPLPAQLVPRLRAYRSASPALSRGIARLPASVGGRPSR